MAAARGRQIDRIGFHYHCVVESVEVGGRYPALLLRHRSAGNLRYTEEGFEAGILLVYRLMPLLCLVLPLAAAEVNGRVKDPSGAAVGGARVTLTRADTTATATVETEPDGRFRMAEFPRDRTRLRLVERPSRRCGRPSA